MPMSTTRKAIKLSLKTLLSGVTGVKSVFTYYPREQRDFPAIVIALEKTTEKVHTMGNPSRRRIGYNVTLYIQAIDPNPSESVSSDSFDDLLDAIDTALRSDKTLGGTVLESAQDYIDTDVMTATTAGQGAAMTYRAIKDFSIVTEIFG